MTDNFRLGDFYRIDDRTGRQVRASETRKQWDGVITHKDRWEPRHPQDFVRAKREQSTVPDPRPPPTAVFEGTVTEVAEASEAGVWVLLVESSDGFQALDQVSIILSSGDVFITTLWGAGLGVLVLSSPLPGQAAAGYAVTLMWRPS